MDARFNGRDDDVPQWKLEARKHSNTLMNGNYSRGGLPRKQRAPTAISLPKLKCLQDDSSDK